MRTRIADEVIVEDSIIVGSDIYEVNQVSWIEIRLINTIL